MNVNLEDLNEELFIMMRNLAKKTILICEELKAENDQLKQTLAELQPNYLDDK